MADFKIRPASFTFHAERLEELTLGLEKIAFQSHDFHWESKHALSDVRPWKYPGNRHHPTEKSVETLKPIIEAFTQLGDLVLDP